MFNDCVAAVRINSNDVDDAYNQILWIDGDDNDTGEEVFFLQGERKSFFAVTDKATSILIATELRNANIVCEIVDHIPRGPEVATKGDKVEVSFFNGPPFADAYHQIVITVPQEGEVEYKTIEWVSGRQCNTLRHRQSAWYACMACCGDDKKKAQKMVDWLRAATRRAIKLANEHLSVH